MNLICPECKNSLDSIIQVDLNKGDVIECEFCGITLQVAELSEDNIELEVVDEGK